jgi:hypothetical protein
MLSQPSILMSDVEGDVLRLARVKEMCFPRT